jgi:hypothetical protein
MDTDQILTSGITGQLVTAVSNKLGIPGDQSKSIINFAIPLLVGGLAKNSTDTAEAKNISLALAADHDGSILEKIPSSLQETTTEEDGMKILEHILGNKQTAAAKVIAEQTKVDPSQVQQILALVAPVVMGALGKQQINTGLDASALSSFLQNSARQQASSAPVEAGLIAQILDRDKDGSIIGDLVLIIKKLWGSIFKRS